MLASLEIRDILLIKNVSINFNNGLNVLTGETGAGKSILLDCINFVMGFRGRSNYVRQGRERGEVVATFNLVTDHSVWEILKNAGFESSDKELIIKRTNFIDGKKLAFINDQRCSSQLLRQISKLLIEIQGQNDDNGLWTAQGNGELLDKFAGLAKELFYVRNAWKELLHEKNNLIELSKSLDKINTDKEYLEYAINELETLAPKKGEDISLDDRRRLIRSSEKSKVILQKSYDILEHGIVEKNIDEALQWLSKMEENPELELQDTIELLEISSNNIMKASRGILSNISKFDFESGILQEVEERLFAIREMSRKYKVPTDDLVNFSTTLTNRLKKLDSANDAVKEIKGRINKLEKRYEKCAQDLTKKRTKAGKKLDEAMMGQLPALKLDQAKFQTLVESANSSVLGNDKISFNVSTNPGLPFGPINKIASGGELSRFLLGLKVSLADLHNGVSLVFDEIDSGVGGATADAVGRRLRVLAVGTQILVVTHSPQVAALGNHHIKVVKYLENSVNSIFIYELTSTERIEEIGRMLSGGVITPEARSAASVLLS